ncbi:MAG: hypothetical protein HC913_01420 [Microscillaceae bacterium]|nr:hypothetical protein [Microscillaceae bacterium]
MEYKLQIPLSFQQLTNLVLQLPTSAQKRLVAAIESQQSPPPKIQMKTVAQIKDTNYRYPHKQPQKLVGLWENEPEMDQFFLQ